MSQYANHDAPHVDKNGVEIFIPLVCTVINLKADEKSSEIPNEKIVFI
jgi:hypothetical protein